MKRFTLSFNPILVKEVRSRMRGWRAFAILTFYLTFLAVFSYGIYRLVLLSPPFGTPLSPLIGQSLFAALANLSLFFVAFLMPALTATAISAENERLTLEMLQATPLSAHTILVGKMVSSAGYIFLLLFAAIPLASLIFTFGGVAPGDLLLGALVILATAFTFGMIGLFFSAWRKRTIQAVVLSYLSILLLIGGSFAVYIFWGVMIRDAPPRHVLLFNPFSALASVLAASGLQNSPMTAFSLVAGWGRLIDNPAVAANLRPLWHYTLAFDLGLSAVLYLLATRFIKPIRPWRIGRRGALVGAVLLLAYVGLSSALFYPDIRAEQAASATPTPFPARPVPMMAIERAVPGPPPPPPPEPTPTPELPTPTPHSEGDNG